MTDIFSSANNFLMISLCTTLYEDMQKEITNCKKTQVLMEKQIECCYQTAVSHWTKLAETIKGQTLTYTIDTIYFFKLCKPKFTAEIEYYNLVYHSLLFKPPDPEDAMEFWKREASRLEKFTAENSEFLEYYASGATDRDEQYFLCFHGEDTIRGVKVYDHEPSLITTGDGLIAVFTALEKYKLYALEQLEFLLQDE